MGSHPIFHAFTAFFLFLMDKKVYQAILEHRETPFSMKKCFDPSIFTWDDVNTVFNNPVFLKNITLAGLDQSKVNLNLYNFCWEALYDRDQIFYGLKNGFTLAVNNIHCYNFAIQDIVATLEKIFSGSADTHLYVSLTDYSKSFGVHHDAPYNLILQVEGECEWKVWNSKDPENAKNDTPLIDTTLEPGDLIFIPSLTVHQCIPKGKRASLSIPVVPNKTPIFRRRYDLFNQTRVEV